VQVVATPHRDRAQDVARGLRQQGFDAYVERRGRLVHVRVRPGRSEPVQRTASRLRRLGHETRVLPE
jgi:cell division septation protein DedD